MSAHINGFSVKIIGNGVDFFKKNDFNYFAVPHKGEYKIKLTNQRETKADAVVTVDGEEVGTWRVNPYSSITLERPANINRKFIFVAENSKIGRSTGVTPNSYNNGIISVIFKPAKKHFRSFWGNMRGAMENEIQFDCDTDSIYKNCSYSKQQSANQTFESGATILGDKTSQHFGSADHIYDFDKENFTTINLRLVIAKRKKYIPLKSINRSTSMPPRIDDIDYIDNIDYLNRYDDFDHIYPFERYPY